MDSLIVTFLISWTLLILFIPDILKRVRRYNIRKRKFPNLWEIYLKGDLNIYDKIPFKLRDKLKKDILIFLEEKRFEGCAGLVITDKKRVIIAAQACLLFINNRSRYYPRLNTVLVYPDRYRVKKAREINGVPVNKGEVRLGESWQNGEVVLAWSNVMRGFKNRDHNVVIHEFAHQLDQETGSANGLPILKNTDRFEWSSIFQEEYEKLVFKKDHNRRSIIDKYGAKNPAEFFAVISELFFENPFKLEQASSKLYVELSRYYNIDIKNWYE